MSIGLFAKRMSVVLEPSRFDLDIIWLWCTQYKKSFTVSTANPAGYWVLIMTSAVVSLKVGYVILKKKQIRNVVKKDKIQSRFYQNVVFIWHN